ncbi:branched-chain amino acid ABC transporter permease [Sinosporangium siamense]|uniref:Branched-chain amino acid ABC transporter permease n=1 Tax=Sinosporangium siamense TaxID=1367973 RepID=A0A919RI57_9ACTN|nr:branched-chain amino acid ABC transporter permease [Sinosporangium siamense]GII92819.1 branched-chain amino acid ABC transporter permease [Sinosporangium siamense]
MTSFLQILVLGILTGGVYALLASGLTLVFGVMRVINIAHGAFILTGAFLAYTLWRWSGLDPLLLTVVVAAVMFGVGWLVYLVALRPVRTAPITTTVLLTFGVALLLEGLMGVVWGNTSHSIRPSYADESFTLAGLYIPEVQVYGGLLALAVLAALYLIMQRTWLGRAIRASSVNEPGARLVGVSVSSVAAMTFALGVAGAGMGGSIMGMLYPFLPGSHYQWIARLLAIVVLGGLGSLPGAVVGALLIGVAEVMASSYIGPEWTTAVPFLVIFIVLLVRPQGLMGTRLREDVAPA